MGFMGVSGYFRGVSECFRGIPIARGFSDCGIQGFSGDLSGFLRGAKESSRGILGRFESSKGLPEAFLNRSQGVPASQEVSESFMVFQVV